MNRCQTENCLVDLKVNSNLLSEESEIFVIPSPEGTSADEVFIIIDNCSDRMDPVSYFFRLFNLQIKPTLHQKNMENYERPFNVDLDG